jgi:hypothetical protein
MSGMVARQSLLPYLKRALVQGPGFGKTALVLMRVARLFRL